MIKADNLHALGSGCAATGRRTQSISGWSERPPQRSRRSLIPRRKVTENCSNDTFAKLPAPPYYAVIFSSQRTPGEGWLWRHGRPHGRAGPRSSPAISALNPPVVKTASASPCPTGRMRRPSPTGRRTPNTSSRSSMGNERWYEHFELRVAKVERAYGKRVTITTGCEQSRATRRDHVHLLPLLRP